GPPFCLRDRASYRKAGLESLTWFYGPAVEDWVRRGFFPDLPEEKPPSLDGAFLETRDGMTVLHVRGTPREMGFQHGTFLRGRIEDVVSGFQDEVAREVLPVLATKGAPVLAAFPGLLPSAKEL